MTVVTTTRERAGLTRAELDALPADGNRHELVDGLLIVTPGPLIRHQFSSTGIVVALHRACPEGLVVLAAPVDVALGESTVVQPDLIVARRTDFAEKDLPVAPLLVVEIASPSTRAYDQTLKKAVYERAGVPSYWLVDPQTFAVQAWELDGGSFKLVAEVSGEQDFTAERPFSITLTPTDRSG